MIVAELQDFGVDEALDQAKDIRVGAALDLADEPLLVGRERRERIGQRKPVRKKLVSNIEAASPDDVPFDVPAHPLRSLDASRIPVSIEHSVDRIHFCLLFGAGGRTAFGSSEIFNQLSA